MAIDFNSLPRRELAAGETLFEEGDTGGELYMLQDGELGVFFGAAQVAVIGERTSFVGEMSALTGAPRSATVKALSPTTLVEMQDPESMLRELPQLGFRLARGLAARLQSMNGRFKQMKQELSSAASASDGPSSKKPATRIDDDEMQTGLVDALDRLFETTL